MIVLSLAMVRGAAMTEEQNNLRQEFQQEPADKVKVKKEDLPESIQKTLNGDEYKGWTLIATYKTKVGEYEVELKKDALSQMVKFDKTGKRKS